MLVKLIYAFVLGVSVIASPVEKRQTGSCPTTPSDTPGYSLPSLPNPFQLVPNNQTVTTKADWNDCKVPQISSLLQSYEAGYLPPKPATVSGSIGGSSLTVNVGTDSASSHSFTTTISYPSGTMPENGWPLLITYGGLSLPVADGIATMTYNNDEIAQQNSISSRGIGLFYDVYGNSANASAMTAWVWGLSRIIDVLETLDVSESKIDVDHLGVTGCSRNGKGALMAGAFEPRFVLTIPQESGAGGDACWRITAYENQNGGAAQPAPEIVQENVWFSTSFNDYVNDLDSLPYDHHLLAALIAPRGLLSYGNSDYEWLSPMAEWGCMSATHTVYQALGVEQNHGFVQVGGHAHCAFPDSLNDSVFAFMNKFLKGQNVSTDYFSTNNVFNGPTWNPSQWITWDTPTLT